MKDKIIIISFLFAWTNINSSAASGWFGKWQSDIHTDGTEKVIMEYDFKNDSVLCMSFYTDNCILKVGRCVSKIVTEGQYYHIGPMFFVSLNPKTTCVSLLKYESFQKKSPSKKQIVRQLEESAGLLFANYENVMMIYVTHDDPNVISFIYGDENNAIEMEFHRPNQSIEQLLNYGDSGQIETNWQEKLFHNLYDVEASPMVRMWKSFGIFMLYLIISFLLIWGTKKLFFSNLSRKNSAKKSVQIRFLYSIIRFTLSIFILGIGLIFWIILLIASVEVDKYMVIIAFFGGGGLLLHLLSSVSLPLNFTTMRNFMKREKDFILYLRGFNTDDYSPELEKNAETVGQYRPWVYKPDNDQQKQHPNLSPLNEKSLAKAWKIYAPVYSVGRPEELESPEGTKRIYLDNVSWQDDVMTLMRKAKYILVCIHPNDNCIWEIQQSSIYFEDKTIYFIDNVNNLASIRKKMGDNLPDCLKSDEISRNHTIVYKKVNKITIDTYTNNEYGLSRAAGEIVSEK